MLPIPGCFALDIMHLPCLNIPDLFIPLWCGKFKCCAPDARQLWMWEVLVGETWEEHGKNVANTTQYIPSSFDRPPRSPAEKIHSGYKAREYLHYFYGLGPCLFHGLLPDEYWQHYCKLVRGFRLMLQEQITAAEVTEVQLLFIEFCEEFETLYVERKTERIHFVRPSLHDLVHIPKETIRVGSLPAHAQWTIERTIGNLGEELCQHLNPYANIAQRGVLRCQVNALKAVFPDLADGVSKQAAGSRIIHADTGEDYNARRIALAVPDRHPYRISAMQRSAIEQYAIRNGEAGLTEGLDGKVTRYGKAI
jgi:hypothetical protein